MKTADCRRTHALFRQRRKEKGIPPKPKIKKKTIASSSSSSVVTSSSCSLVERKVEFAKVLDAGSSSTCNCSGDVSVPKVPSSPKAPMKELLLRAKRKMGLLEHGDPPPQEVRRVKPRLTELTSVSPELTHNTHNNDDDPEEEAKIRRRIWIERERAKQRKALERMEEEVRSQIVDNFAVYREFLQLIGATDQEVEAHCMQAGVVLSRLCWELSAKHSITEALELFELPPSEVGDLLQFNPEIVNAVAIPRLPGHLNLFLRWDMNFVPLMLDGPII